MKTLTSLLPGRVFGLFSVASVALAAPLQSNAPAPEGAPPPPPATAPVAPPVAQTPLDSFSPAVRSVVKLLDANVDPKVILSYIQNSPVNYQLSASDIIALKARGVPDDVVTALLDHKGGPTSANALAAPDMSAQPQAPAYPYTYSPYPYSYPSTTPYSYPYTAPLDYGTPYDYGLYDEYPYSYSYYPYSYPYYYWNWWYSPGFAFWPYYFRGHDFDRFHGRDFDRFHGYNRFGGNRFSHGFAGGYGRSGFGNAGFAGRSFAGHPGFAARPAFGGAHMGGFSGGFRGGGSMHGGGGFHGGGGHAGGHR